MQLKETNSMSDILTQIIALLGGHPRVQTASSEERRSWLENSELIQYSSRIKIGGDGLSFSSTLVATLHPHPHDFVRFLQLIPTYCDFSEHERLELEKLIGDFEAILSKRAAPASSAVTDLGTSSGASHPFDHWSTPASGPLEYYI